jgi:hypothetical protein
VVAQFLDSVDVDQHGWGREAEFEHGHEALASGQELGFAATLIKESDSLSYGLWRLVLET